MTPDEKTAQEARTGRCSTCGDAIGADGTCGHVRQLLAHGGAGDIVEELSVLQSKYWRAVETSSIAYEDYVDGKGTFRELEIANVIRDAAWSSWRAMFHGAEVKLARLRGAQ